MQTRSVADSHRQIFLERLKDSTIVFLTRGASIISYYVALQQYMRNNPDAVEVGAYFTGIIWLGNIFRLLLSPVVNEASAASLLIENEVLEEGVPVDYAKLQAAFRAALLATVIPTTLAVGLGQAYTASLSYIGASEHAANELRFIPTKFAANTLALMLMSSQSNFANGCNDRIAYMIIFMIGAIVMFGSMQLYGELGTTIDYLILANLTQMSTVSLLSFLHTGFMKSKTRLLPSLFTRHGWLETCKHAANINRHGMQPTLIMLARLSANASIFFFLKGDDLKAFQAIYNVAAIGDGLGGVFEQRLVRETQASLEKLNAEPDELRAELRRKMFYSLFIANALPVGVGVATMITPKIFDLFIKPTAENAALAKLATENGKSLAPFMLATLYISLSVLRGMTYSVKKSPLVAHQRINQYSTIANVSLNLLFPVLGAIMLNSGVEPVAGMWLSILIPQLLLTLTQLAMTCQFINHEAERRKNLDSAVLANSPFGFFKRVFSGREARVARDVPLLEIN